MDQEFYWRAAAWTPCPVNSSDGDDHAGDQMSEADGPGRTNPDSERPDEPVPRENTSRGTSRQRNGTRAATVPSGLLIVPLPMDTVAAFLLILLAFTVLMLILADRPEEDRPDGLGDPFRAVPISGSERSRES